MRTRSVAERPLWDTLGFGAVGSMFGDSGV